MLKATLTQDEAQNRLILTILRNVFSLFIFFMPFSLKIVKTGVQQNTEP